MYENAGDTLKFASKSFIDEEVKRIQTGKMTSIEKINSIISEIGDETDIFSRFDNELLDKSSSLKT